MHIVSPMAILMALIITLLTLPISSEVINSFKGAGYYVKNNNGDVPPFELHYYKSSTDFFICTAKDLRGDCVILPVFNSNKFQGGACTNLTMYPEFTGKGFGSWAVPQGLEWFCRGFENDECLNQKEKDWDSFARYDLPGKLKGRAENVDFAGRDELKALRCSFRELNSMKGGEGATGCIECWPRKLDRGPNDDGEVGKLIRE